MNFKRKQIKGRSAKNYKEWYDETKQYRISWSNQVAGVAVTPCYYACVRCVRLSDEDFTYWSFVGRRGSYRTLKAAIKECQQNKAIWDRFLAIEGRARVGNGKSARLVMRDLPVWVAEQAPPQRLKILSRMMFPRRQA